MSYLDKIIKQSPWILALSNINEDIHLLRLQEFKYIHHEHAFLSYCFEDGIYIVTGPRQIGKSTHLKMLIQQHINENNKENFLYFNCDLLDKKQDIVELVEEYLQNFPSKARRYILLDEITAVKDSFLAIKYLVDSGHFKNITYILTGSNTISIKKTGEYLPGRRGKGIDFIFYPLTFKQYINLAYPKVNVSYSLDMSEKDYLALKQKAPLDKYLDDYLVSGGIPRVINEFLIKGTIEQDIFSMYRAWITSEIAKADKKEFIAKSILERVLFSLGSDISYNAFAQDTGIGSHNTVYEYLDFFINCNVLSQIYHFDVHQKKVNYRKNKKIYFNDPFIYSVIEAWLTGKPAQDYEYLSNPILKSRLIENLVLNQLKHFYQDIFFYKEVEEIDFVTKDLFLEIKYQNKIIKEDYALLLKQKNNRILVTKKDFRRTDDLLFIPVECFLLLSL